MKNGFTGIELIIGFIVVTVLQVGVVVSQKVYHRVTDGECKNQSVMVPVLLDEDCKPNVLVRKCDNTNEEYKVNCLDRLSNERE